MAVTEDLLVKLTVDSSGVVKAAKVLDKSFKGVASSVGKAEKGITGLDKGLEKAALSVTAVNQATQLLSTTIGSVSRTLSTFVGGFSDFESALIGVQKTTDLSGDRLSQFGKEMQDLSQSIPVTANELLNIAQNAGQLGVETKNIEKFTETVAKIGFATDLSSEQAAQAFARILTVTTEGTDNIDTFASTIVSLGNNFAATESEITRVATEMANATAQFGIGSSNVLGISTALKAMGQQAQLSGSVVGKTLREMNSIIRDGSGPAFESLADLTGIAGDKLKQTFETDATSVFESFITGLGDIGKAGGDISATLEVFGLKGDEVNKVLPSLATNAGVLSSALKLARGEAALTAEELEEIGALNVEAGRAFDSLKSQVTIAENSLTNLVATIGEGLAPAITILVELFVGFITTAKDVADGLNRMGIPGQIILWTSLGTVVAATMAVAIIPMVGALKAAGVALLAAGSAASAFLVPVAVVSAKVIAITAAVAALASGIEILVLNWDELGIFVSAVVNELATLFKELGLLFLEVFGGQHTIVVDAYHLIASTVNEFFSGFTSLLTETGATVSGFWDTVVDVARFAFDQIVGFLEPFVTPFVVVFEGISDTIGGMFTGILDSAREMFNVLISSVVQPAIDAINSVIEAGSAFFDGAVQKIEISLGRIGDEAELTGKRLDTGISGEVFDKVAEQINKFKGTHKEATAAVAASKPTFEALKSSIDGTGISITKSDQQFKALQSNLKGVNTNLGETTKLTKQLGTVTQLSAGQIKDQQKVATEAAKKAESEAKERLKLLDSIKTANFGLAADIQSFGATESEVIRNNLDARLKELSLIEQKTGKTKELAEARRLAAEMAALEISEQPTNLGDVGAGVSGFAEGLFSPDVVANAMGVMGDLGDAAMEIPGDLAAGLADIDVADIFSGISAGLSLMSPDSINQAADMVSQIGDFPQAMLNAFMNLDQALKKFLESFPDAMKRLLSFLPVILDSIIAAIPQVITMLANALPDLFVILAEAVGPLLTAIISKLPLLVKRFMQAMVRALPILIKGLADGIISLISLLPEIMDAIISELPALIEALAEAAPEIAIGLVEAIINLFLSGGIFKIVAALAKATLNIIPSILKGLFRGFGKMFKIEKILSPIKKLFDNVIKPIFNLWITPARVLFEKVIKPIFNIWITPARVLFEQVIKPIFNALPQAFESLVALFNPIIEAFEGIESFFGGLDFNSMFDFTAIGKGFTDMFALLDPSNLINKMFDFGGVADSFQQIFDTLNPGNVLKKVFGGDIGGGTGTIEGLLQTDVPVVKFAEGGMVPGTAKVAGDSLRNDTVAAFLSPGEAVIPRSFMNRPEIATIVASILDDSLQFRHSKKQNGINVPHAHPKISIPPLSEVAKKGQEAAQSFANDPIGVAVDIGKQGLEAVKEALKTLLPGFLAPLEMLKDKAKEFTGTLFERAAGFNEGGLVGGNGGIDSVAAALTPGEFVVNRPAVQAVGEPFMRALNNTGTVPVNQEINVTLNIDAGKQTLDESFIKNRVMPAAVEAVKRASLDRKFTMSARGLRSS